MWHEVVKGVWEGNPIPPVNPETLKILVSISKLPTPTGLSHRFARWERKPALEVAFLEAQRFATGRSHYSFLTLAGPPGVGKTHLAIAILWDWLEAGRGTGAYWQVEALLDHLRGCFKRSKKEQEFNIDEELEWFKRCGLLVLDDLGAHQGTEWAEAKLDEIVDSRYINQKATVFTTNATLTDLPPRIVDRMREGMILIMKGESHRKIKQKEGRFEDIIKH